MRALACLLFLVACGGSGEVEGDPLVATTLMGQHAGMPWTPMYGFGRAEDNNRFALYFGSGEISCADEFRGVPRDGNYAATGISGEPMVASHSSVSIQFVKVVDNDAMSTIGVGDLMITGVTETEVTATLAFDLPFNDGRYALTGTVTVLRCP